MKNPEDRTSRRSFLGFLARLPLVPACLLAPKARALSPAAPRACLMNDCPIAGYQSLSAIAFETAKRLADKLRFRQKEATPENIPIMKTPSLFCRVLCCYFSAHLALPSGVLAQTPFYLDPPTFPATNTVRVTVADAPTNVAVTVYSTKTRQLSGRSQC
ncbi:MAG: hypothetical protein MUE94_07390 [Verrucomicrobia bacterium]|jgi:hypothetical protein|nr:hypothetical protein [Verrucomicrobiota bacterium]